MLLLKKVDKGCDSRGWILGNGFKDGWVLEGVVDGLVVKTGAVDSEG